MSFVTPMGQSQCIGVISDGKAGHLNQSLGLAEALQRRVPALGIEEIPAMPRWQALRGYLHPTHRGRAYAMLIGAGHGTHLSLLAQARAARCPSVVLMRPSLPKGLFDLCIEPRHDGGRETPRCWLSDGPLNRIRPAVSRAGGLVLIGGPSDHFHWDEDLLLRELSALFEGVGGDKDGAVGVQTGVWQLSTSRRTPDGFLERLIDLQLPNLEIHDVTALPTGWLADHLPMAERCWVTPDSASMVYESLSAGCAVGVFGLAAKRGSRVAAAMADLKRRGLLTDFEDFAAGRVPRIPDQPLAEADRCADRLIDEGWLS